MDMKRSSRALIFGALLFVLVGLGSGQPESTEKQANCTYTALIETTCSMGAGTSDRVSLRFGDSKSNDILVPHLSAKRRRRVDWRGAAVLTDVPQKPFKACGIDQFQVIGSCVESPICYLFFKHTGNDRWRPGLAQVLVPEISHFSSKSFYFRQFLSMCGMGLTHVILKSHLLESSTLGRYLEGSTCWSRESIMLPAANHLI